LIRDWDWGPFGAVVSVPYCAIASRIARLVNWRTWRDGTKDAFARRASGGIRRDAIFICQRTSRCSRAREIGNEQPLGASRRIEVGSLKISRTFTGLKVQDSRLISFGPFSLVFIMESDAASELRERKREEYEMQLFGFHSRVVYATSKSPSAF